MKEQNIKDALGGNIKFHDELDRLDKDGLVGINFILRDGRVIEEWDGKWGTTSFALLMVELEDKKCVTTLCGGVAVVRQVKKLLKRGQLPGRIKCFLNYLPSESTGQNYYLLDWQDEPAPVAVKVEGKPVEPVTVA